MLFPLLITEGGALLRQQVIDNVIPQINKGGTIETGISYTINICLRDGGS